MEHSRSKQWTRLPWVSPMIWISTCRDEVSHRSRKIVSSPKEAAATPYPPWALDVIREGWPEKGEPELSEVVERAWAHFKSTGALSDPEVGFKPFMASNWRQVSGLSRPPDA